MNVISSSRQVGHAVREKRRKTGITQKMLAERAGVSERLVIALELGDATGIQLNKLLQVLSAVGLSLAVLETSKAVNTHAAPDPVSSTTTAHYASAALPDLDFSLPAELTLKSLGKQP